METEEPPEYIWLELDENRDNDEHATRMAVVKAILQSCGQQMSEMSVATALPSDVMGRSTRTATIVAWNDDATQMRMAQVLTGRGEGQHLEESAGQAGTRERLMKCGLCMASQRCARRARPAMRAAGYGRGLGAVAHRSAACATPARPAEGRQAAGKSTGRPRTKTRLRQPKSSKRMFTYANLLPYIIGYICSATWALPRLLPQSL